MRKVILRVKNLYHTIRKYWWTFAEYKDYLSFSKDEVQACDIVIVSHTAIKGGAPLLVKNMCTVFKEKGYHLIILVLEPGALLGEMKDLFPTILCLNKKKIEKIARMMSEGKEKTVICSSVLSGDCCEIFDHYGLKTISMVYELPNTITNSCAEKKYHNLIQYSDCVVYPSNFVKERNETFFSIKNPSSLVRAQGLYNKSKLHMLQEEAKKVLGFENKIVILNVASTSRRKGFDYFIDTAKLMPELIFVWVGVQYNAFYKKCVSDRGGSLPQNFVEKGYVSDINELTIFYDAADVFMLTSREEPFGSVFIEAFDAGTPVVAFEGCGGYLDFVKNAETGWLAEKQSAEALKSAVSCVLKNKNLYLDMSKRCRKQANKLNFRDYVDFVEGLVNENYNE